MSDDGSTVEGLLTERDIVRPRRVTRGDPMRLDTASVMSGQVPVCTPTTDIVSLMRTMTERRYRTVRCRQRRARGHCLDRRPREAAPR